METTTDCKEALELVRRIAGKLARRLPAHVELDELIAAGNLGLVEALTRFDASRGVPLAGFVAARVQGAMLDRLRDDDLVSRQERSRLQRGEQAAPSVTKTGLDDARIAAERGASADELIEQEQSRRALARALESLDARSLGVMRAHFYEERSLREIGETLGVTESRVCQLVGAALARLRLVLGVPAPSARRSRRVPAAGAARAIRFERGTHGLELLAAALRDATSIERAA